MVNTPERIYSRLIPTESGCLESRNLSITGYGIVKMNGYPYRTHRLMYEAFVGPIPEGYVVDHLCHNRACANPAHLEAITPRENALRRSCRHSPHYRPRKRGTGPPLRNTPAIFEQRLITQPNGCQEWPSVIGKDRYGYASLHGRFRPVHVHLYEAYHGPLSPGYVVHHRCNNRTCANLQHLEAVPGAVNVALGTGPTAVNARKTHCHRGHALTGDNLMPGTQRRCRACVRWRLEQKHPGVATSKRTHCPQGHPYSPENTYLAPNGWRQCRECRRAYDHKRYAKAKSPQSSP